MSKYSTCIKFLYMLLDVEGHKCTGMTIPFIVVVTQQKPDMVIRDTYCLILWSNNCTWEKVLTIWRHNFICCSFTIIYILFFLQVPALLLWRYCFPFLKTKEILIYYFQVDSHWYRKWLWTYSRKRLIK